MKYFYLIIALVLFIAPSYAHQTKRDCNKSVGNWVGAATVSCPDNAGHAEFSGLDRDKCKY